MAFPQELASDDAPCLPAEPLRVAGQELRLFDHSTPVIAGMIDDIDQARESIWLESYIFADDAAGQTMAAALCRRAQAGVDVRVMYDAVGSFSTSAALFEQMRAAGVQVHAFHTLWEALRRWSLFDVMNRRNHRKLLVVDRRVAWFGGMNVVDQSGLKTPADVRQHHLPVSAGWRDLHVRLAGPQAAEVADICRALWDHKHGRLVRPLRGRRGRRSRLRLLLQGAADSIQFFDARTFPGDGLPARVFVPLIHRARRSIVLSMAYFVPVGRVLRALLRARRRGVAIHVIVPERSDVPLVRRASRRMYGQLLRRGFRIYERRDQMLHSKAMVIDGRWTIVGSCNLDPRSLRHNLEFIAVIASTAVAQAVRRLGRHEMRASRRITPADVAGQGWLDRLLDRLAWSLRRWL
jgi:cardiolipin synthase